MNKQEAVAELIKKLQRQYRVDNSTAEAIVRSACANYQYGAPIKDCVEYLKEVADMITEEDLLPCLVPDYEPIKLTMEIQAKGLFSALAYASILGTTSLVDALYSLQRIDNNYGSYTVVYDDPADYSFYFVRMRIIIHEDGEREDVFAGNGGIIFHSYCKSWSIHT